MAERADVVVVGAGQGGAHVAMFLRQQKFAGSITIVGAEPELPYERPAMSKEYLAGERHFEKTLLRPASFWADKSVVMRLGERVTAIDPEKHVAQTAGGDITYGTLVWAAGGRARRLTCDGADAIGVHTVRDRADVDRMRAELETRSEIVVIGAGYIGLEVAAVLRKQGKRVTVLEAQDRVLSRVAGEALSRFFEAEHRGQGVDIRLGAEVVDLTHQDGRVRGVRLASGEVLPAELVVVGIGIAAEVEPLAAAGAKCEDGVLVDLEGKTSLPDVYALGDCAAHANVHASGRVIRLESIQNANDQAAIIARAIAGTRKPEERYDAIPWFWSNQYDLRLQTVGLFRDHDEVVLRGDPQSRSFSVVYLRAGRVIALDCINKTKDYVQGKALIASGREVDRVKLAADDVALKDLVSG